MPALEFRDFHYKDCLTVCRNMRQADREEISAIRSDDADPEGVARDCEKAKDYSWIGYVDGEPFMVLGAVPMGPKVVSVYMLASNRFSEVGLGCTRWALRVFVPFLRRLEIHRAECHSLHTHTVAHRWLRALGGHVESEVPMYGKRGETFLRFSRVWPEPSKAIPKVCLEPSK